MESININYRKYVKLPFLYTESLHIGVSLMNTKWLARLLRINIILTGINIAVQKHAAGYG